MNKSELIHIHELLNVIRKELGENDNLSDISKEKRQKIYEDYMNSSVTPKSIHKSKNETKDALFSLLDAITTELESSNNNKIKNEFEKLKNE